MYCLFIQNWRSKLWKYPLVSLSEQGLWKNSWWFIFLHKKHGLLPMLFKLGSSRSPQESHQHVLEKFWGTYGEIVKQAVFFSTQTIRIVSVAEHNEPGMVLWPGDQRVWHDSAMGLSSASSPPKEPRHLGHAAWWKQLTFTISQIMLKQIWEGRSWQEPSPRLWAG